MAFPTFSPDPAPSPGMTIRPEVRLQKAGFGDGYTQALPDGLNHIRRVVELRWEVLTAGQAADLETFFVARGGAEPFRYQHHGSPFRLWTCESWTRTSGAPSTFSCTLREWFGAEIP